MLEISNTATITRGSILFNAAVVGEKGVGKTTVCASFPNPLFLDHDGGMASQVGSNVPFIRHDRLTWETYMELAVAIQKRSPEGNVTLKSKDGEVQMPLGTLVIDSMTKGHGMFLRSAMALGGRKAPAIQDWGLAADRIIQFIDMVKPYVNLLVVCHYEIVKDGNLDRVMAQIRMPGQLVDLLPIALDEMWRIRSEITPERHRKVTLWTVNDGIYPAATRHGRLGMPPFVDITADKDGRVRVYEQIMAAIKWPEAQSRSPEDAKH